MYIYGGRLIGFMYNMFLEYGFSHATATLYIKTFICVRLCLWHFRSRIYFYLLNEKHLATMSPYIWAMLFKQKKKPYIK